MTLDEQHEEAEPDDLERQQAEPAEKRRDESPLPGMSPAAGREVDFDGLCCARCARRIRPQ
jgi:hypothetical protein